MKEQNNFTTKDFFNNNIGAQILFDVFLTVPVNHKREIAQSFRHFSIGTPRIKILEWFELNFRVDFTQLLVDTLTLTGKL